MAILITGVYLILLASCTSFHSNSQSNHRCWLHDQEQLAKHETFYEKCIHFLQQTPKHQSLCHQNKVSNCLMWSWPLTIRIPIKSTWRSFHFFLGRLWSHFIWAVRLMFEVDLCLCECHVAWIFNCTHKATHQQLVDFADCLHSHINVLNGSFMQSFVPHPLLRWTMIFGHSDTRIPRLPLLRTWNCWKCCQLIAPSGPLPLLYIGWVLSFFSFKHLGAVWVFFRSNI